MSAYLRHQRVGGAAWSKRTRSGRLVPGGSPGTRPCANRLRSRLGRRRLWTLRDRSAGRCMTGPRQRGRRGRTFTPCFGAVGVGDRGHLRCGRWHRPRRVPRLGAGRGGGATPWLGDQRVVYLYALPAMIERTQLPISLPLRMRGTRQNASTDHLRQNVRPSRGGDSARTISSLLSRSSLGLVSGRARSARGRGLFPRRSVVSGSGL